VKLILAPQLLQRDAITNFI